MKLSLPSRHLMTVLLAACGFPDQIAHADTAHDGFNWSFTPYLWASDTSAIIANNDEIIADSEIAFIDIVDKVDFAFQGHLEGLRDRFGFFFDLTYLSLSDDINQHDISVKGNIDMGLYELAAIYNPAGTGVEGLSVFGGVRYLSLDVDIALQGEGPLGIQHSISQDSDLTDFMFGARYILKATDKWELGVRGDYSFGDTDGSWNVLALVGYRVEVGKFSGAALFGYRYFDLDLKKEPFEAEFTLSGPIIGMRFEF